MSNLENRLERLNELKNMPEDELENDDFEKMHDFSYKNAKNFLGKSNPDFLKNVSIFMNYKGIVIMEFDKDNWSMTIEFHDDFYEFYAVEQNTSKTVEPIVVRKLGCENIDDLNEIINNPDNYSSQNHILSEF